MGGFRPCTRSFVVIASVLKHVSYESNPCIDTFRTVIQSTFQKTIDALSEREEPEGVVTHATELFAGESRWRPVGFIVACYAQTVVCCSFTMYLYAELIKRIDVFAMNLKFLEERAKAKDAIWKSQSTQLPKSSKICRRRPRRPLARVE